MERTNKTINLFKEKYGKTSKEKKAYTAEEVEAMGFSTEWPKSRLDSFFYKSSPYYRCNHS